MFAPSIGVPEDIANANSTACLAAFLGRELAVDMGDALGAPSTVVADARGVGGLAKTL
jgi:trans-2,3-dihydro-3-hydroxyanthranilate isomerase